MQPVIVGVDLPCVIQERTSLVDLPEIHPGLGGAQIQSDIALCGFCQPRVEIRGFLLPSRDLVGIGQLGLDIGCFW